MNEPCRVCDDGTCHGCRIAERKNELAAFVASVFYALVPTTFEWQPVVDELQAAGVLSDDDAAAYRDAERELKHQFLRIHERTKAALAVDVVHDWAEANQQE